MSREQERIKRQMEKNTVIECNKVQSKFCLNLFRRFSETEDLRHQSYIDHTNKVMLGTLYYKGIGGITSMQMMNDKFNDAKVAHNIRTFLGEKDAEYLPHSVTMNEYLERLEPKQLQNIIHDEVYDLIRRKSFNDARFQKKWMVVIDGSQLYSGSRQLNDKCLERHYSKDTPEETVNYHCDVLEAKIIFGEKLVISLGSEFIENNGEDAARQKEMSEEQRKQDCETKAFKRLAKKIKKRFPKLPLLLLLDSIYASETVMDICQQNYWDFIIRFKAGSIPSIV